MDRHLAEADPRVVTKADIERAVEVVRGHVYWSPIVAARNLSKLVHCNLFLKAETLQRTGAYKERGALNKLMSLSEEERARGVIAASAGNHAQGLAYHAARLGVACTIVMPKRTPLVKITRTEQLGAKVVLIGENFDRAYEHARDLEREAGAVFVHPFDDPHVIAGQGTVGYEIMHERRVMGFNGGFAAALDAIVVPVGGGGLIAGLATYVKETNPHIRIIGVEPEACPAMRRSVDAGRVVTLDGAASMADGIAVRRVGELTFDAVQRYVDDIVLVNEQMIAAAVLALLEQERLVCEGAGAAGLAAVMGQAAGLEGKNVLIPLTGGNIDVNVLQRIIARGLAASGRNITVRVRYEDVSGAMGEALRVIADQGSNILNIEHHRFGSLAPYGYVDASLVLETRSPAHADQVEEALRASGHLVEGDPSRHRVAYSVPDRIPISQVNPATGRRGE